ncbi:hypothetical protein PENSPDRAFT_446922 [Peniophora sp. CONT]|nr:hypothetical protein PENSPDRAFT_446922 [Peniophora sp. CONT]
MNVHRFQETSALIRKANDAIAVGTLPLELEQSIDREILELEEAARLLRATRNAGRPLLRLPSETLGEISEALSLAWPAMSGFTNPSTRHEAAVGDRRPLRLELGWVLLGHVCHRLRSVLLSRIDIWANNICSISHLPETVFSYCGNAPIRIDVSRYNRAEDDVPPHAFIEFVAKHSGDSRTISIDESGFNFEASILANLNPAVFSTLSFPHLTHLSLRSLIKPRERNSPGLSSDILELPNMISPNLRSLHLKDYMLPSFNTSALTSLVLEFSQPTYLLSPSVLLGVLDRCPQLIYLTLHKCIPILPQKAPGDHSTLASLETVDLMDSYRRCLGLLPHLVTPTSTRYRITFEEIHAELRGASAYLDMLAKCLQTKIDPSTITGVKIYEGLHGRFSLHTPVPLIEYNSMSENTRRSPLSASNGYRKQILCSFVENKPRLAEVVSSLSNVMDYNAIETLQIGLAVQGSYDDAFWTAILSRFPNVTTLCYTDMWWACGPSLNALKTTKPWRQQTEDDVTLPRLRFIWVDILDLREHQNNGAPGFIDFITWSQFLHILSSRQQAKKQIEHLRIDIMIVRNRLQARREFLPRLREIVPHVEVKEVRENHPDDDL